MPSIRTCLFFLLATLSAGIASAATITIDMNGFVATSGGQVTGDGLKDPVKFTGDDQKITLENLQAGGLYYVDFFHNSGPQSSDFSFTLDKDGKGVETVSLGGEKYTMVVGFKPGATTLKLNTHDVTFNPDRTQTGGFNIPGLTAGSMGNDTPPITAKLIPGTYAIDNFGGPLECKVYFTTVDSNGKTGPFEGGEEYAEFVGSEIKPRATKVHFKITATAPVNYIVTHAISEASTTSDNVTEFDLLVPVGGGGVNVWTFGPTKVFLSTAMLPGGKPFEGTETENDLVFAPRLRYSKSDGFYFETPKGKSTTVMADVNGQMDDKLTVLKVTFTATIVPPKPIIKPGATTAPATTKPAAK